MVVPEFELQSGELRTEADEPFAIRCLIGFRPDERRRRLHDTKRALFAVLLGVPGPVIGELFLLREDQVAIVLELIEILLRNSVLDDQPAVLVEEVDLLL